MANVIWQNVTWQNVIWQNVIWQDVILRDVTWASGYMAGELLLRRVDIWQNVIWRDVTKPKTVKVFKDFLLF